MSPQSGHGYEASYPAATRARAHYTYDPGGRTTNLEHYWDTWGSTSYTSEPILGNHCDYDAVKGLKSQSDFYVKNPSSSAWLLERSEEYAYDADQDFLTSADYNDGLANENPSWSYDAAGNRNDATVVDNLNRATTIGGVSRTYDILGNTLTKGSVSYGWDCLNRMVSFTNSDGVTNYAYRADRMRVTSMPGARLSVPPPVLQKRFRYDGQMPVETSTYDANSTALTVDRNGLGARGIDFLSSTTSSGTSVSYPVYDAHGNMVATLAKSGSGYAVSNRRAYDAWGGMRQGATSGDPRGRYCGSLGHVQDDESALLYMRARYYDPSSGRFSSEDSQRDGNNWFAYCGNDPVNYCDHTGNWKFPGGLWGIVCGTALLAGLALFLTACGLAYWGANSQAAFSLMLSATTLALGIGTAEGSDPDFRKKVAVVRFLSNREMMTLFLIVAEGLTKAKICSAAQGVIYMNALYCVTVLAYLAATAEDM